MKKKMSFPSQISHHVLPWLLLLLLLDSRKTVSSSNKVSEIEHLHTYIIQLDHSHKPESFLTHESWHRSILKSLSHPADDQEMLLYSYTHALHGFSARLTKSQLSEIERSPAHIATYQESFGRPHTTYSFKFLGLNHKQGLWPNASYGDGVIIGVIDSGIWPESDSFNDKGMAPVPKRWKGKCENGTAFSHSNCNRKLIGARSLSRGLRAASLKIPSELDYDSARDFEGHGTHTSSTAAGNGVLGANFFGQAGGTARGVAPRAHVAMYKALFSTDIGAETEGALQAAKTDVLAAIERAIADGVDILSMSIGFPPTPYYEDPVAIGALSATEKGIFVSCSAGNDGDYNTTNDGAPWITTVGASTLDRSFTATMTLENGLTVEGTSYYPESIYITDAHLYYANGHKKKSICYLGTMDHNEARGKIVLCDKSTKINLAGQMLELERVGAYAGIFILDQPLWAPVNYTIPSLIITTAAADSVRKYVTGVSDAAKVKSMILASTIIGVKPAPQVAYFSSRGPDPISPGILRPDIVAPGMDILAAYVPNRPYMTLGKYNLVTNYALSSGTSMAAPHAAGVAALIKKVHPEWSPAAIRSALMTTAYVKDNTGTVLKDQKTGLAATPLDFGAGHIDPNKAMDPGLIYDMGSQDYIDFVCSLGYTEKQMKAVIRSQWNCSQEPRDLNYPSFIAIFRNKDGSAKVKKFSRVVTNVGNEAAVYQATVEHTTPGLNIKVEPSALSFTKKYQKHRFAVTAEIDKNAPDNVLYAFLKWIDQHNHVVSSPIVAFELTP